jgi:hypothetical protein
MVSDSLTQSEVRESVSRHSEADVLRLPTRERQKTREVSRNGSFTESVSLSLEIGEREKYASGWGAASLLAVPALVE